MVVARARFARRHISPAALAGSIRCDVLLFRKIHQNRADISGRFKGFGKPEPFDPVSRNQIQSFRIEAGKAPIRGVCLAKHFGVQFDRIAVVFIHMRNGTTFHRLPALRITQIGQQIRLLQFKGLAETAVQAGALKFQSKKCKIAEVCVKRSLRVPKQITPPGPLVCIAISCDSGCLAKKRNSGMRQRITFSGLPDQQRTSGRLQYCRGVTRQGACQDERCSVEIRRDRDTAGKRVPGPGLDCCEGAETGGPDQGLGHPARLIIRRTNDGLWLFAGVVAWFHG